MGETLKRVVLACVSLLVPPVVWSLSLCLDWQFLWLPLVATIILTAGFRGAEVLVRVFRASPPKGTITPPHQGVWVFLAMVAGVTCASCTYYRFSVCG